MRKKLLDSTMNDMVSIITPMYNSSKFIKWTVQSVLSQVYKNWEMIIIDDCSTDDCVDIVKSYESLDSRIKLLLNDTNRGAALSRNIGMEKANGRYIAFLDSDDLWLPTKLIDQLKFMEQNKVAFSFCSYEIIDECGNHIKDMIIKNDKPSYYDLIKSNYIGCLTVILDLKLMNEETPYMPNIKTRHDHGLWLLLINQGIKVLGYNKILAKYRNRSGSISYSKVKSAYYQWKLYRDIEKIDIFHSIYYMICWAWYGVIKRI